VCGTKALLRRCGGAVNFFFLSNNESLRCDLMRLASSLLLCLIQQSDSPCRLQF
jgi:hypothetical protein